MKRCISILLSITLLTACGGGDKKENAEVKEKPVAATTTVTGNPVDDMVNEYMQLKDALVKDSIALVNDVAKKLSELTQPDSTKWNAIPQNMRAGFASLTSEIHARTGVLVNAPDLKIKRSIFREMTPSFRNVIEQYGSKNTVVYQQHCPMAFDNTGASWLSMETKIRNPYLPKTMLKCGSVEDTVHPKN